MHNWVPGGAKDAQGCWKDDKGQHTSHLSFAATQSSTPGEGVRQRRVCSVHAVTASMGSTLLSLGSSSGLCFRDRPQCNRKGHFSTCYGSSCQSLLWAESQPRVSATFFILLYSCLFLCLPPHCPALPWGSLTSSQTLIASS